MSTLLEIIIGIVGLALFLLGLAFTIGSIVVAAEESISVITIITFVVGGVMLYAGWRCMR